LFLLFFFQCGRGERRICEWWRVGIEAVGHSEFWLIEEFYDHAAGGFFVFEESALVVYPQLDGGTGKRGLEQPGLVPPAVYGNGFGIPDGQLDRQHLQGTGMEDLGRRGPVLYLVHVSFGFQPLIFIFGFQTLF
jgi:hypothetical protein